MKNTYGKHLDTKLVVDQVLELVFIMCFVLKSYKSVNKKTNLNSTARYAEALDAPGVGMAIDSGMLVYLATMALAQFASTVEGPDSESRHPTDFTL